MKLLYKLLLWAMIAATALPAAAYDFMAYGICYDINDDGNSVTVTYERSPNYYNNYIAYRNASGSLTIPESVSYNGKNYSVTAIGYEAFSGCSGFTGSLTIPNSVTSIGNKAFLWCSGFTGSLTIPNSVTEIGFWTFNGCSGFTGSLNIPNSVTSIGEEAFNGCSGFTGSLTIPNSVTSIGSLAFSGCSGFTGSLIIPNSVTSIGNEAFNGCSGFTGSLAIPNTVTSIGEKAFNGCSGFTGSLTIPNSVTEIGGSAFYGCSGFTGSLTIGNSVTTIGERAFDGCSGFTGSLTIGNSVTSIYDWAFYGCSGFTGSLTIPNSVTFIGFAAFSNCSGFTGSLTIPSSVTTIYGGSFSNCTGLERLTVEENNPIYDSRDNCNAVIETATNTLVCGISTFWIPNSVTSIGYGAFYGSSGSTGVLVIPESVTDIGSKAFEGCSGFNKLIFNANLSRGFNCSQISYPNYPYCPFGGLKVSEVIIGDMVRWIPMGFLCDCNEISGSLTIGKSVTGIGWYAFYNCSGLTEIKNHINHPIDISYGGVFTGVPKADCKLYVPIGRVDEYRSADTWKEFEQILEGDWGWPVTSVTLDKIAMTINPGESGTLTATVEPDDASNKTLQWTTSDAAIASVDQAGVVTGVASGTATITATTTDGTNISASCQVTVRPRVASITLVPSDTTLFVGSAQKLTATVFPANAFNKTLNWYSSNAPVASVDQNGMVTAKKAGKAVITAAATDGSGVKATCRVTVVQPVTSLTLAKSATTIYTGCNEQLTATIAPDNATNKTLQWTTSDAAIATVDQTGLVTALTAGTAVITAATTDGSNLTASCTVTALQSVTGIELNKNNASIYVTGTEALLATVLPSNAHNKALNWKSSNAAVASVDGNGVVTANKLGSAFITATATDGSGVAATCRVSVTGITGIAIDDASVYFTGTTTLTPVITPADVLVRTLTWTSSDPTVATVDENGVVTGRKLGTATITATATDGTGVAGSCQVTVTGATSVTLNKTATSIYVTGTETLTPTVLPSDLLVKSVSWSSSNSSVVQVSRGVVTARKLGTATITATATDGSGVAGTCQVTVTGITSLKLNKSVTSIYVTGTEQLVPTFTPDDVLVKTLTWHSSDPAVATVDQNGVVTTRMLGTTTITATTTDGTNLSDRCVVNVKGITDVQLNKSQLALYVGGGETLTATITPSDVLVNELTWTTSNPDVATIDQNGRVTAIAEGTATITVTTTDGTNLSATCEVKVVPQYALSASTLRHTRGEPTAVEVLTVDMINKEAISNLQFDLTLPAGVVMRQVGGLYDVTLDDARKTRNHSVNISQLANGDYRVVVSSPQNRELKGNSGNLVHIVVEMEQYHAAGEFQVTCHNITLTEPDETEHLVDDTRSAVILSYVLGDADADIQVDAADYVTTALHILERPTLRFYNDAANVNDRDTVINVTDLTGIVNIALGIRPSEVRYAPRLGDGDATASGVGVALSANATTGGLECVLKNDMALAGLQLDVELPHGVTVEEAQVCGRAARHEVTMGTLADGRVRLLVSTFGNQDIAVGDDCVLRLALAGDRRKGMAHLSDITLVERDLTTHHADDLWLPVGATAIDDLTAYDEVRIYAQDGSIIIESPEAGTAQLIQVNGIATPLRVEAGRNVYPMATSGIAIVKLGAKAVKVKY